MLNIPFLKKLAWAAYFLGWCNLIIGPPAAAVFAFREQAFFRSYGMLDRPFPWGGVVEGVLTTLAVGIGLMVLAQLVHLAIGTLEHLGRLAEADWEAEEPEVEPT